MCGYVFFFLLHLNCHIYHKDIKKKKGDNCKDFHKMFCCPGFFRLRRKVQKYLGSKLAHLAKICFLGNAFHHQTHHRVLAEWLTRAARAVAFVHLALGKPLLNCERQLSLKKKAGKFLIPSRQIPGISF